MKKLYSIVLMAAALLVSTNAWATVHTVATAAQLDTAWVHAQNGDVIQLTANITLDKSLWLGTKNMKDQTAISIELDLNGKVLSIPATMAKAFVLSHGALNVTTSLPGGQIIHTAPKNEDSGNVIFSVFGSTYKDNNPATQTNYFSHLTIDAGVSLVAKAIGIVVNNVDWPFNDASKAAKALGANGVAVPTALYSTNVSHWLDGTTQKTRGIANGVRIDVSGSVEGYKYGIKSNGTLGCPSDSVWGKPDGFYQDTEDTPYKWEANDGDYTPFIYIHSGANIFTNNTNSKAAVAAYSGGYARWKVEGSCKGSTGVFVKSGEIVLNDAVVESNYSGATYTDATATSSGVNCGGSGIVMQSASNYAGDIDVTISGDTKVAGTIGYAIDEAVTTKTDSTKVDAITITGGTFEGGNQGTMRVTETTVEASADPTQETIITIIGGSADNSKPSTIGTQSLTDYLADQTSTGGNTTHVTYVENEKGNTVMVISQGEGPDPSETKTSWNDIAGFTPGSDASWTGTGDTDGVGSIAANQTVRLGELQILSATASAKQELTIAKNGTLIVGTLLMNKYAQIIVEAGGMLIVEGTQGITAPVASNIILKASDTDQALFLINPAVSSNRHPNGSVKMVAANIGYEVIAGENEWYWHRFALPITQASTWTKVPNVPTYVYGWNYSQDKWEQYSALTMMVPFQGYTLTANNGADVLANVEYTFTGELAGGNEARTLHFQRNGFNIFGNSYTGHIYIDSLVNQLMADPKIDGTIWVWGEGQNYYAVPLMTLHENPSAFPAFKKEIAPMHTFIMKQNGSGTNATVLNYESAIWGNPRYNSITGNHAPRRYSNVVENTHMNIVVTAENGKKDVVMFSEAGKFSDEYENGYDGAKYMNENALNMYATVNGADYSVVATDNLEGKTLTINTIDAVNYTMSFEAVNSDEYAIRDNVTGAIFAIEEGASYEFAAQPGSVVEGRFEIVSVRKVTTALENAEVKANAKGIYTIMGQYVGEDFNALPAGIYVVDGVKIVK